MSRLSLRVRLAALIGIPLIMSGAVLLAISYALVTSSLSEPLPPQRADAMSAPRRTIAFDVTQRALVERTRTQLVGRYAVVLAGSVAVAVALSWLMATRLLGALRKITAVAQRIGRGALDERVGLDGPRDEMRELGDTFDAMLGRLDAVFNAHRRFIADASHELRTPLTAMRAEIEVLCGDPAAAAADVAAATSVLRRQLACSEELIDALLVLAKSEPELLANTQLDLAELAAEALADAGPATIARHLRVDTRLGPALTNGDFRLLARLTANLIANACTHNHAHGWISVATTTHDGRAVLTVSNSGPVISDGELAGLTQAFRRGGRARVGTGHGLGLAIVAAIARAHDAELRIENPDTGGLRVDLCLPRVR
jgi:signal transduction histidine kinase